MSNKYQHLLSPIKVGNLVFKNRLTASPSEPHYIQGPEPYPTENIITHYANKAKNGAALVTCGSASPVPLVVNKSHHTTYDIFNESSQNYLSQLTEAIHFYGSNASMAIVANMPNQYDVSAGLSVLGMPKGSTPRMCEELPTGLIDRIADDFASQAAILRQVGFDMVYLHMCYRTQILGRFLSPLTNKRTDQFGGSLENRARFPLMVADHIKQKCGSDFLIEASISGCENYPGGLTLEDTIKYARMFAGHIDLLQLRAGDIDLAHPAGFTQERTPFLYMAEAVKSSGTNIAVVTVGGYHDLGICENVIANDKADFIAMARSWISNPEYGRLAYEGRGEDLVPCIRCNRCHKNSKSDPWVDVCSVNPTWGFEHKIERMIGHPFRKKKVAVVGGGPGGMEAALIAAGRGHQVTLYEKSSALGGLLKTSNYPSFKWPLRAFKNYLIHKIEKSNIKVYLNIEATPEMLKKEEYDAVLAAVGAAPAVPDIPGVNGNNVVFAQDVYGKEEALEENVVVIGGGETGVETGMYLAEKGHKVTVLEMGDMLASKSPPIHFYTMFKEAWEKLENFNYILKARCNSIGVDNVTYIDIDGKEQTINTGNVVIAVGFKPKNDLAMEFYGASDRLFLIGECNRVGNVQKVIRSAFSIASTL